MTTFPRAESRRLYSWWWDSHISPKNSKWLQENLTDMDMKVKAMIKLIEEDADSFARRAEMYYKKRPELMKLVEEFYRAYRALAERYDHATGALRHAHRTMSVAFSDHIPLALPDESLSNSTPETPSPRHGMFDADDPQNDAFGMPTPFNAFDRTAPPEETETFPAKKGLNHFNGMLKKRDGVARVKLPEGNDLKGLDVNEEEVTARVRLPEVKVRKSLNFEEEEETGPTAKVYIDSKSHLQPELKQKEDVRYGVKHIQEQVSQLSSENQKLKVQIELESKHLDLSRAEVQNLREEASKLEAEKDAALLQKQLSHENISSLEIEISRLKNEIRKLNEEMEMAGLKLSGAEQQCLALEKANQSLQLELEEAKIELEELRHSLNSSGQKLKEAEMSVESKEQLCNQSNEKVMLMTSEIETLVEKLAEVERSKGALEEEVSQLKGMNYTLNEHNLACALGMKHLEDEIISLKEIKDKLENEIENRAESNQVLQREFESLKDEKNEMDLNHQSLREEMEAASLHIDSLEAQVKDYQYGHVELKERCSKLEDEKLLFLNKLKDLESVSERNSVMENSLSDANVELEELREKIVALKGSCESLHAAVSSHAGEKTALAFQIETLAGKVEKLSDKNTLLENSLDDANTELEGLRSKLRDLEESFQSLSHANSDLVAQRNNLISQVESIQQSLTNLEASHATLEGKHSTLVKEKDLSVNKILKLEDSLSVMQKDYDSLIRSKDISLAAIENQFLLLQEDGQLREEELEEEQQRCFSHTTQIFVLQRCLHQMSNSLIIEKEKYQSLIKSSEIQLAASESQIHLLQEERKARESKIEEEEQKSINSMLEIFILQRCLSEMKGDNLTLLQECHKHLEASRCADELIKQLEDRELAQKENITLLMEQDQIFRMEIMVYLNILKQTWLEKALLSTELEKINKESLVLQREHLQLFEEHEQLCHGASATDFMSITLKAGLVSLTGKLINLSEKVHNLIEEKNALEEENRLLCVEASTMENLYLFFRCLNSENVGSLLAVKNGLDEEIRGSKAKVRAVENENKQLKESLVFFEDLRSRITISEFDFHFARSFCEELMLQVEAGENLLTQKCGKLEVANKELDDAKIMRSELEKRVAVLLEGASCKDNQIACVTGENRTLKEELNRYKVEVETLKMRQQLLSCELREEKDEVDRCEGEITELFGEAQASVVNATVLDEKMFELASRCAGLNISAMVLLETMKEEIIVRNKHTFDLKKKIDDFENENGELRTNLKVLSPLIFALGNGISNVEKQICRLEKLDGYQENSSFPHQEDHKTSTGNHGHSTMLGVSEMQNLIAKVEALQNLLVGAMDHLDQDRLQSAAQLQSARTEIEELKLKQSSIREEGQGKETSNMVKDIELDQASSSFGVRMIQGAESDDQMLNSWGAAAAAADNSNLASVDHGIEAVQEAKTEKPSSELATEKAFGVYKMEISREIKESQEEWNRRVVKRLAYDAEKLSALRAGADELKLMMEKSGPSTRQNRLQFGALQAKLKDAEEAIFDLIDRNGKLTMMVEAYSDPYDGGEEMGRAERGRVVEQARRASDRIGTLELELQKIDYIFLKLQEEWEGSPSGAADRSPRVLLRDYIYGRKDKHGKKRGYFCGCMRPRTQDGY